RSPRERSRRDGGVGHRDERFAHRGPQQVQAGHLRSRDRQHPAVGPQADPRHGALSRATTPMRRAGLLILIVLLVLVGCAKDKSKSAKGGGTTTTSASASAAGSDAYCALIQEGVQLTKQTTDGTVDVARAGELLIEAEQAAPDEIRPYLQQVIGNSG